MHRLELSGFPRLVFGCITSPRAFCVTRAPHTFFCLYIRKYATHTMRTYTPRAHRTQARCAGRGGRRPRPVARQAAAAHSIACSYRFRTPTAVSYERMHIDYVVPCRINASQTVLGPRLGAAVLWERWADMLLCLRHDRAGPVWSLCLPSSGVEWYTCARTVPLLHGRRAKVGGGGERSITGRAAAGRSHRRRGTWTRRPPDAARQPAPAGRRPCRWQGAGRRGESTG